MIIHQSTAATQCNRSLFKYYPASEPNARERLKCFLLYFVSSKKRRIQTRRKRQAINIYCGVWKFEGVKRRSNIFRQTENTACGGKDSCVIINIIPRSEIDTTSNVWARSKHNWNRILQFGCWRIYGFSSSRWKLRRLCCIQLGRKGLFSWFRSGNNVPKFVFRSFKRELNLLRIKDAVKGIANASLH